MEKIYKKGTRPNLKTKGFSTLHIDILEQILYSGKTNQQLNLAFGYTLKSHCVVDHSRKVMRKLLVLEGLKKEEYKEQIVFPRACHFFWKRLLNKHKKALLAKAVSPEYYDEKRAVENIVGLKQKSGTWNNYYLN